VLRNMLDVLNKDNMKHAVKYHAKLNAELGTIYRFRMMGKGKDVLFISDPDDSRSLLSNEGQYPYLPGFEKIEEIRKTVLKHQFSEPGLLSQGEVWSKSRKAVQQDLMRPKSALYYVDELNDTTDEFLQKIVETLDEKGETSDLNHHLQEYALEASGIMFIGTKLGVLKGSPEGSELMKAVSEFISKLNHLFNLPVWALRLTGLYSNICNNMSIMFRICNDRAMEAIKNDATDGSLEGTVLGNLMKRCEPGSQLPIIMSVDAMSAGIDTTAHTATFLLYHLACNPDKQEKLYQEILSVMGSDGTMTESRLAEMKYLKACLQESQRILPIAFGTARKTQTDLILSGYHVPKGSLVVRIGLASLDSRIYPDALTFQPERFIREDDLYVKANRFANLPFGHGARACPGQRFARLENYMVAFKVIQKYRLEYHNEPIEVDYTGVGKPDRLVRIKMIKRE